MTKIAKTHPADIAARAQAEAAKSFSVHLRRGPDFKINEPAATLAEAITIADRLSKEHANKNPLIYAITQEDFTVLVPKEMIADARSVGKPARKPQEAQTKKLTANAPEKAALRAGGQRAAVLAAAEKGILPPPPDFSAPTHARFRKKLADVFSLIEAGNIEELEAFKINPSSSSPKAILRYRNLALVALAAQRQRGSAD